MRYQNALVLSTLAIGQAAAINHKHASFHARRSAAAPGPEAIEWNTVVRDTVDYDAAIKAADIPQSEWDAIWAKNHGGQPAATAAPAAPAKAEVAAAPEAKPTTDAAPAAPSADKSSDKPSSAKPSKAAPADSKPSKSPSTGGGSDIVKAIGCAKGNNPTSPNGGIWVGDGGHVQMTWTNDADADGAVVCWQHNNHDMFHLKEQAAIAVNVGAGKSVDLSMAFGFSGACSPAYADSSFSSMSGQLNETLLEFTADSTGVFDVSQIVTMKGSVLAATGSRKCTSGVLNGVASCLFGCTGGAATCHETGTYGITAGADSSGMCNVGVDTKGNGGASGGCQFNPDGDHLQVTMTNSRSWPSVTY